VEKRTGVVHPIFGNGEILLATTSLSEPLNAEWEAVLGEFTPN